MAQRYPVQLVGRDSVLSKGATFPSLQAHFGFLPCPSGPGPNGDGGARDALARPSDMRRRADVGKDKTTNYIGGAPKGYVNDIVDTTLNRGHGRLGLPSLTRRDVMPDVLSAEATYPNNGGSATGPACGSGLAHELLLCPNGNQNHYQRRTYVCLQKQRSKSRHPTYVLKLITQVMTTNLKPTS